MRDVFWEVLSRSITAGWLVLAVAALRLILKRAPRRVSVLLWGMVALRLLCPVSIESRFSLVPQVQALTQRLLAEAGLDQYAGQETCLEPCLALCRETRLALRLERRQGRPERLSPERRTSRLESGCCPQTAGCPVAGLSCLENGIS